jgi:hypothetical protein
MVARAALALVALASLSACRTELRPLVAARQAPAATPVGPRGPRCPVRDYRSSGEVPSGATNLGWVQVPRAETEEATFERLREAVCARGGTAYSQPRWLRPAGAGVADPPAELEANAWSEAEVQR